MKNHAIVIGGTGMLQEVSSWLTNEFNTVTVIGRSQEKHQLLLSNACHPERIHSISVDYLNEEEFTHQLEQAIQHHGDCELVVAWIHSVAKNAWNVLYDVLSQLNSTNWELFHVQGSSASRLTVNSEHSFPNCHYHQVILGFIIEKQQTSRWLTHKEIATGVIQAIQEKQEVKVVGTVEPWELRPFL